MKRFLGHARKLTITVGFSCLWFLFSVLLLPVAAVVGFLFGVIMACSLCVVGIRRISTACINRCRKN